MFKTSCYCERLRRHGLKHIPVLHYLPILEPEDIDARQAVRRVRIRFVGLRENVLDVEDHVIPFGYHPDEIHRPTRVVTCPLFRVGDDFLFAVRHAGVMLSVVFADVETDRFLGVPLQESRFQKGHSRPFVRFKGAVHWFSSILALLAAHREKARGPHPFAPFAWRLSDPISPCRRPRPD